MIRLVLFLFTFGAVAPAAIAGSFYVEGAGGVPLATTEVGPTGAPGILFLHGIGHGRDSFREQFVSALAEKYHLVAFDLRGHGMSGKPWKREDYVGAETWAEDVARVMGAAKLARPVVVAWSYGTLVVADLVRVRGAGQIAGLVLVSALGGLVDQPVPADVPPDLVKANMLRPQPSLADQREVSRLVAGYLTYGAVPSWWAETTLALNLMVPAYTQPLLRLHASANRDLAEQMTMPVLIVHGAKDAAVPQAAVESLARRLPKSQVSRYDEAGHAPFVEDAPRFNRELSEFIEFVRSLP